MYYIANFERQRLKMGLLIDLDVDSFQNVSSHSPQVMVYGFGYCKHLQLIYTLHTMQPPIVNKVFECSIGNTYKVPDQLFDDKLRTTIEGRLIKQFVAEPLDNGTDEKLLAKKYCTRVYKTGILNLVFENFLRKVYKEFFIRDYYVWSETITI